MSALTCRPVCAVHDALLEQGVVDAHDDAAGHLRLAALLVDDQAAVLHGHDAGAADDAGLGVDLTSATCTPPTPLLETSAFSGCREFAAVQCRRPWPVHAQPGAGLLPGPASCCWRVSTHLARLDGQVLRLGVRACGRSCRTGRRGPRWPRCSVAGACDGTGRAAARAGRSAVLALADADGDVASAPGRESRRRRWPSRSAGRCPGPASRR